MQSTYSKNTTHFSKSPRYIYYEAVSDDADHYDRVDMDQYRDAKVDILSINTKSGGDSVYDNRVVANAIIDTGPGTDVILQLYTGNLTKGERIYHGGTGNDTITLNTRFDTKSYFAPGDGRDLILNSYPGSTKNQCILNYKKEDLWFSKFTYQDIFGDWNSDLLIRNVNGNDRITIHGWFESGPYKMNTFVLPDGEVLLAKDVGNILKATDPYDLDKLGTDQNNKKRIPDSVKIALSKNWHTAKAVASPIATFESDKLYVDVNSVNVLALGGDDAILDNGTVSSAIVDGGYGNDTFLPNPTASRPGGKIVDGNRIYRGGRGDDLAFLSSHYSYKVYFAKGDGKDRIFLSPKKSTKRNELILEGYKKDALWFVRVQDSLRIKSLYNSDSITIGDWFKDDKYKMDSIALDSGKTASAKAVQKFVQAMSSYDPDTLGIDANNKKIIPSTVQSVLAANWKSAS